VAENSQRLALSFKEARTLISDQDRHRQVSSYSIAHRVGFAVDGALEGGEVIVQATGEEFAIDSLQQQIGTAIENVFPAAVHKNAAVAHQLPHQVLEPDGDEGRRGAVTTDVREVKAEVAIVDEGVVDAVAAQVERGMDIAG